MPLNLNEFTMKVILKNTLWWIVICLSIWIGKSSTVQGQNRQKSPSKAAMELTPFSFEYIEIEESGSSVQREKPERVAHEILVFSELD